MQTITQADSITIDRDSTREQRHTAIDTAVDQVLTRIPDKRSYDFINNTMRAALKDLDDMAHTSSSAGVIDVATSYRDGIRYFAAVVASVITSVANSYLGHAGEEGQMITDQMFMDAYIERRADALRELYPCQCPTCTAARGPAQ